MTHVKLLSVPDSWTVLEIITGLKKAFNWKDEENLIKLLHFERLSNGRKHVRLSFQRPEMIQRMMNEARATNEKDMRSIRINNMTVLFESMNNLKERFIINTMSSNDTETKKTIFAVNCARYAEKKSLISGLDTVNSSIEYVSFNFKACYVKLNDEKSYKKYSKYLTSREFRYKISQTQLSLRKCSKNFESKKAKDKVSNVKRSNAKESSNNVIPKLLETVNQISTNIAKVVETQIPYQANNSAVNICNSMMNRNVDPCNSINALLSMQPPVYNQNFQLMLGLMKLQQFMNNNNF